jgi:DNA polymerase (family X)
MIRIENAEVAALFSEMADILEIKGDNPFRIRAFRRVAQALQNLPEHVKGLLEAGTLASVPGIGEGTIGRIQEIFDTGDCEDHRALVATVPPGLLEMLRLDGVGPKTVRLIHAELGLDSIDALEAAAQAGHIARLPRMGEKSQEKLLRAIEAHRRHKGRILLRDALPQGLALCEELGQLGSVRRIELAGSTRRRLETIGDLDVLVAAESGEEVTERFVTHEKVKDVLARGETRSSVHLGSGLQVDLRVIPPTSFGAALHYFTGSKMHNIAIRDRGKRQGLKISEYGVHREPSGELLFGGATEAEIFAAVGLPFIPPELRESQGEIEAAEEGRLPDLLEEKDLRGDLHMHTKDTDGSATAAEMAAAARALGYAYIAITDHSRALAMARGLDVPRLRAQTRALRELEGTAGIRILSGIEVDVLADGELDLPREELARLDWVVASVHSHFNMDAEVMTSRIVRAMESGVVDCLGHPSGRLLGQRDAYPVDLDAIVRAARRTGVALELNAFPDRLDLDALHCRQAKEQGVPVVLNTDSHATWHLARREFGIFTARRGWLEARDVLNAGPLEAIVERRRARMERVGVGAAAAAPDDAPAAPVSEPAAPAPDAAPVPPKKKRSSPSKKRSPKRSGPAGES